jgi:hypothetical protein
MVRWCLVLLQIAVKLSLSLSDAPETIFTSYHIKDYVVYQIYLWFGKFSEKRPQKAEADGHGV